MLTIKFYFLILIGTIQPTKEKLNEQPLYHIIEGDYAIEHATKNEILDYLKTGTFVYADFSAY
jgi:hypothetical protein